MHIEESEDDDFDMDSEDESSRKTNMRSKLLHDKLSSYASKSPRVKKLYEFNKLWREKMRISENTAILDFSADNIERQYSLVRLLIKVHFVFSTLRIMPSTSSEAFSMFMTKSG